MHNIQATVLCLGWTTILIWIAVAWHKVTMVVMEKTTVTKWTTVACLKIHLLTLHSMTLMKRKRWRASRSLSHQPQNNHPKNPTREVISTHVFSNEENCPLPHAADQDDEPGVFTNPMYLVYMY
jgi:type VI protein secretion system component VasK